MSSPKETECSRRLVGTYNWELLLDIDNTNNDGIIRREFELKCFVASSFKGMKKSLETVTDTTSAGVDLGGGLAGTLFQVLNIGVKGEVRSEIKSSYETLVEKKEDYSFETTKKDIYEVGPHSRLKLYRLVFNGPGVHCVLDTLSSEPTNKEDVPIDVTVKQIPVLKEIDVVYTKDSVSRPVNTIRMVHGEDPNISAGGYGETCVWLVPKWTKYTSEGATGVDIVIQDEENSAHKNLARDAGGKFRYIKMLHDSNSEERITKIGLYRADNKHEDPLQKGWNHKSIDINYSRRGDYLYLVWNTHSTENFI